MAGLHWNHQWWETRMIPNAETLFISIRVKTVLLYFTKALLRWLWWVARFILVSIRSCPSSDSVSSPVPTGVSRGSPKVEVFLVGHGTSANEFGICSLHILGGCSISDTSGSIGGALASATFGKQSLLICIPSIFGYQTCCPTPEMCPFLSPC